MLGAHSNEKADDTAREQQQLAILHGTFCQSAESQDEAHMNSIFI